MMATLQARNRSTMDAVLGGYLTMQPCVFPDSGNVVVGEFRMPVSCAILMTTFVAHIKKIFSLSSNKKMTWLAAMRCVAMMGNNHIKRYRSVGEFPNNPVNVGWLAEKTDLPITISGGTTTKPNTASGRREKIAAFPYDGTHGVRRSINSNH